MNDVYDRRVRRAEGNHKIFANRVKYIIFFLTVATGVVTLWDKCGAPAHKEQTRQSAVPSDSLAHQPAIVRRKEPPLHKRRSVVTPTKEEGSDGKGQGKVQEKGDTVSTGASKPAVLAAPLERAVADNIEFRLMRAEGSAHAQTIKMTVVLITTAADWSILQTVRSIIDNEGNEYKLKGFTDGASDSDTRITLDTGVPIRCTFTFGGVLPTVGMIKLFKFQYWGQTAKTVYVAFRDIPIIWR